MIEILGSSAVVYLTGQDPWDYVYAFTTSYPGIWLYRYVNDIDPPEGCTVPTEQMMLVPNYAAVFALSLSYYVGAQAELSVCFTF